MLRTTPESVGERQPENLEARYWIVADARLDDRAELIAGLQRSGRAGRTNVPDSGLILLAFGTWGTGCGGHPKGAFSFCIWGAKKKNLCGSRDHFGIKTFYY